MVAWKRSGRAAVGAHRLARVPRLAWLTLGWLAAAVYGFLFLRVPVAEGVQIDGVAISRAGFVIGSLLYPEGVVDSWFGQGQLAAGFADRLPVAAGTLLWLVLATAVGLPLVDCAAERGLARARGWAVRLERFALAALVGLALLSTLMLLVGLAGGLHSRVPLAIGACGLAAGAHGLGWWVRRRQGPQRQSLSPALVPVWLDEPQERGLFDRTCRFVTVALACWSAAAVMLGAWVPASEFDVLEYHLQAPKEFFEQGSIRFLPHNVYANMPLGTEMHTLAMMTLLGQPDAWLGGLIGKSITAAFSLIGALLLGGYLAQRLGSLGGWWGAGLWLATPGIAQVAVLGLIDGALATYVLAAALCVARALEMLRSQFAPNLVGERIAPEAPLSAAPGWWALSGILAGAAAAAKYPGLVFAVVPVCAVFGLTVWLRWWNGTDQAATPAAAGRLRRLQTTALLLCGLLVTCAPWYAKNWVQAGNPVYPLAASIFGGKTLSPAKVEQWQRAHRVPRSAPPEASLTERFAGIVGAIGKDVTRLVMTSPYVQPAMICGVCLALGLWLAQRNRVGIELGLWLGWSLWIVGVWWLATHRIDRFWLPLTGLWAAVAAIGLCWLRGRVNSWLAYAIVTGGLVYGGLLNSSSLIGDNRYFVSLSALRSDVSSGGQLGRVPAAQGWMNEHLAGSHSRVLLIGQAAVFEYRMPVLYSSCFDTNPGEAMLKDKSPAEQTATLHAQGITHIMIDWDEIARYRSPGNYGFSTWPQPADIEPMIASGVVSRVDWPIRSHSAELLKVE